MKNTLGLLGWNGKRNVGDDAMTAVIIKSLSEQKPDITFDLLADQSLLADYLPGNKCISAYPFYNAVQKIPFLRSILMKVFFLNRFIKKNENFIVGGGSIFHGVKTMGIYERIVKERKGFTGAFNVSFGPFKNKEEENKCIALVKKFDFISVRDKASEDFLQKLNLSKPWVRGMDIALLYPSLFGIQPCTDYKQNNTIGISLRADKISDQSFSGLMEVLKECLEKYPDITITVFVFCDHEQKGDLFISEKIKLNLNVGDRVKLIYYSYQPADFYREIGKCKVVLAMRLHASVLAYSMKVPFVVLSYHPKCNAFAEDVGLEEKYIFDIANMDTSGLTNILKDLIQGEDFKTKLSLGEAIVEAKKQAEFLSRKMLS